MVTEDKFVDILATKIMADLDFTVKEEIQKALAATKIDMKADLHTGTTSSGSSSGSSAGN